MKRRFTHYIFLIGVLASYEPTAWAGSEDNYSGDIMSLNFYAHEGLMVINPSVTTSISDAAQVSTGGGSSTSFNTIYFGLNYGLLPRLQIGISDQLLWDSDTETSANPSLQAGPSNPTGSLEWRFWEDGQSGFSGDFLGAVTPWVGANVPANPTLNIIGNNLAGGTSAEALAILYWRWGINEISLGSEAIRQFQEHSYGSSPATTQRIEPFWENIVYAQERIHLSNRFYLEGKITNTSIGTLNHDYANQTTNVISTDPFWTTKFSLGYRPEPFFAMVLSVTSETYQTHTGQVNVPTIITRVQKTLAELSFVHQFKL